MGKEKYLKDIENIFKKSAVVDAKSIERFIKSKKRIKQYQKQLIRNLILKGKIKRLTKGYYSLYDDPSLLVFCFKPAYLGLQDAMSFNNLWEQETIPVIITSKKIRQGIRKVFGNNVLIRRIKKRYIFGFEYQKQKDYYLPYSNIEKTFIDMIYFNQKISEEDLKNILKQVNKQKLKSYLKIYPLKFRKNILNFIS
ncbi:hypothetical protein J4427_01010 [Candidatus Woesearchaeota archaeon]|nr:hypothetical protein [uncultured archaeon]MBS3163251.1 hypothetical protein [Candidatus Woesearchaeota archaeon]